MQFDWALAIERNRADLLRILAALFALAGLDFAACSGPAPAGNAAPPATLPRHLRNYARRILRSAESAVRRLVVIAARDVNVVVREARARKMRRGAGTAVKRADDGNAMARRSMAAPSSPPPGTGNEGDVTVTIRPSAPPAAPKKAPPQIRFVQVDLGLAGAFVASQPEAGPPAAPAIPAFSLADPRKRFDFDRPRYARTRPRIHSLGDNPLPVYLRRPAPPEPELPMPDDPVPAAGLCRRLVRLKAILDDLGREARRLARREARRRHGGGPAKRLPPLRPGWPPGWRRRSRYDVDEVLKECHRLALWSAKGDP